MNKYQEALENVKADGDYCICYSFNHDAAYEKRKQHEKGIEVLQELVEKATPKKPSIKTPRNIERPYCDSCGLRLKKSWIACPRCATRIDWSEEDD